MNYISTRNKYGFTANNFSKITMEGLAPDGGLYVPENFPSFTSKEIHKMTSLNYSELFKYEISALLLEIPLESLKIECISP